MKDETYNWHNEWVRITDALDDAYHFLGLPEDIYKWIRNGAPNGYENDDEFKRLKEKYGN